MDEAASRLRMECSTEARGSWTRSPFRFWQLQKFEEEGAQDLEVIRPARRLETPSEGSGRAEERRRCE